MKNCSKCEKNVLSDIKFLSLRADMFYENLNCTQKDLVSLSIIKGVI